MDDDEQQRHATAVERYEAGLGVYVGPQLERQRAYEGHAVSYAQAALSAILLLNGGALVAYPAFIDATRISSVLSLSGWTLIFPLSAHIAGLVLAVLAYTFAFYVMTRQLHIARLLETRATEGLQRRLRVESLFGEANEAHYAEHKRRDDEIMSKVHTLARQANVLERIAIWVFFHGSAVCFVAGVVLGLRMLSIAGSLHMPDGM